MQAEEQGSLRQAIMYDYNNKSNEKQRSRSNMESELVLPCYNFPLSVSIPQSCGKRGDNYSNCFVRWIFLGGSTIGASVPNVEICFFCSSLESVYFTSVDLKTTHDLKVETYVLFSGNFEDFKTRRQHLKLRNLALFYVWEDARFRAH